MITIDSTSFVPLYEQVKTGLRREIALGALKPGAALPSIRDLAARLLINPNTVARIYRDLEKEGLLETRRGSGTYVAQTALALAKVDRIRALREQLEELVAHARLFGVSDTALVDLVREIQQRSPTRAGKA